MENGEFAQKSKCSIFHYIFKNVIFQRRHKGLLWSKGLRNQIMLDNSSEMLADNSLELLIITFSKYDKNYHKTNHLLHS